MLCTLECAFKSSIHFSRTIIKVVMEFLVTGRVTSTQDEIQAMHNQIRMLNSGKLGKLKTCYAGVRSCFVNNSNDVKILIVYIIMYLNLTNLVYPIVMILK